MLPSWPRMSGDGAGRRASVSGDILGTFWGHSGDISVLLNRAAVVILEKMSSEMPCHFKDKERKDVELGHQLGYKSLEPLQ